MDQLPRLEEGLRLHGVAWLERRLSSFNKESLIAIAASLKVFLPVGCRKNDIAKFQCAEDIFQLQRLAAEGGATRLREKLAKFGALELKRMAEHIGVSSCGRKGVDYKAVQPCVFTGRCFGFTSMLRITVCDGVSDATMIAKRSRG